MYSTRSTPDATLFVRFSGQTDGACETTRGISHDPLMHIGVFPRLIDAGNQGDRSGEPCFLGQLAKRSAALANHPIARRQVGGPPLHERCSAPRSISAGYDDELVCRVSWRMFGRPFVRRGRRARPEPPGWLFGIGVDEVGKAGCRYVE